MPIIQLALLGSLLAWSAAASRPALAGCEPGAAHAPGSVLVGFDTRAAALAWESGGPGERPGIEHLLDNGELLPTIPVRRVHVTAGWECEAIEQLRLQPGVAFAELDYAATASAAAMEIESSRQRPYALSAATAVIPTIPNDPLWPRQWGMRKIRLPEAWSLTTGSPEVVIAMIDSGVQTDHPDLAAKLWTNPGEIPANQVDDDGNGKVDDIQGWHYFHMWNGSSYVAMENANVRDDFGHGTHTAGIAAAVTDNGVGVAGAAWGARIMPVKVLDQYGSGWYSDIAAGIVYAADNGARVLNLSLGGPEDSQTLRSGVDYALSRGALVIAAAGNTASAVLYPAAYAPVLAVSATDANDGWASFSNYGPQVDLAAPGVDIFSTWYRTNYFTKSGTSMAAPHVAGAAALLWSRWPDLTAGEVITALIETASDAGAPGFDPYTGWGRVDAFRALLSFEPAPDLWVQATAPETLLPGEAFTYTYTYGNQGELQASGVVISATLNGGVEALGTTGWQVGALEAHSGPFTLTLPARAPVVATATIPLTATGAAPVLTSTVQIAGAEEEMVLQNNLSTTDILLRLPARAGFITGSSLVLVGQPVAFINQTTGADPVTYLWDFGDGSASQARDPVHIYSQTGVFTVTLTAANDLGTDRAEGVVQVSGYILFFPFAGQ